ncbi:hypothetical protein QVD99_003116 [Batrachochytrium dendrobatidis]|nr:hypothetical protein QVD99_003116 [Batrachochytrium dendrobatidis]
MHRGSRQSHSADKADHSASTTTRVLRSYPAGTRSRTSSNDENSSPNTHMSDSSLKSRSAVKERNYTSVSNRPAWNARKVPCKKPKQDQPSNPPQQQLSHDLQPHNSKPTRVDYEGDMQAAYRKELQKWKTARNSQKLLATRKSLSETVKPFVVPLRQSSPKPLISIIQNDIVVEQENNASKSISHVSKSSKIPRPLNRSASASFIPKRIPNHSLYSTNSVSSFTKKSESPTICRHISYPSLKSDVPLIETIVEKQFTVPQNHWLSDNTSCVEKSNDQPFFDPSILRSTAFVGSRRSSPQASATLKASTKKTDTNKPELDHALKRLKRTRLFRPFNCDRVSVQVINSFGTIVGESKYDLPTFNFFSVKDAQSAVKVGNYDLARAIFQIIAAETRNTAVAVKTPIGNGKWCVMSKPPTGFSRFWIAWANLEEMCGNKMTVLELFDRGDEAITLSSEKNILQTELYTYILRSSDQLGASADEHDRHKMDFDDDISVPVPTITDLSEMTPRAKKTPPLLKPLQSSRFTPYNSLKNSLDIDKALAPKPQFAQLIHTVAKNPAAQTNAKEFGELVGMLDQLSISEAATPKQKPSTRITQLGTLRESQFGNTFDAKDTNSIRGSVTILTPVRAKRNDRDILGVDQVITPVRRSVRNFKELKMHSTSTSDALEEKLELNTTLLPAENMSESELIKRELQSLHTGNVSRLMDKFGYAFVPNKALTQSQSIPTPVASQNWLHSKSTKPARNRLQSNHDNPTSK